MNAKISVLRDSKEFRGSRNALSHCFRDALERNYPLIERPEEIVPEIILHQYVNSPFSEKIRKIFAHKQISWRSVEQPVIMPKPKLIPLTGGDRRIPVLQIGADVRFDPPTIINSTHDLRPDPTSYP